MARKFTWDQVKKACGASDSELDKVMKDLKWVDRKNNWTEKAYDEGVDPDDDDYFTADGLKVIKEELGVDDDKEEKSSKKSVKPTSKKGKDDDDEDGEKPTYAVVKATVKSFDFKSEKQINGIIDMLTKKLDELNADDEPEEEEDETPKKKKAQKKNDDDSDPNEEGRYRGWKITHEGIFAIARKGDNQIKATLDHGNIRQKIDAKEDK